MDCPTTTTPAVFGQQGFVAQTHGVQPVVPAGGGKGLEGVVVTGQRRHAHAVPPLRKGRGQGEHFKGRPPKPVDEQTGRRPGHDSMREMTRVSTSVTF